VAGDTYEFTILVAKRIGGHKSGHEKPGMEDEQYYGQPNAHGCKGSKDLCYAE
jgi:hypothetical protein